MINKIIKIKSGIDINSQAFKDYCNLLKEKNARISFLELAINGNSKVLVNPINFEEKEYKEFTVDDISFAWSDDKIIGHTLTNIKKRRFAIPTSSGSRFHLDDYIKNQDGTISFSKIEQFVLNNLNIDEAMNIYLHNRIHGKLESIGSVEYEETNKKQKV